MTERLSELFASGAVSTLADECRQNGIVLVIKHGSIYMSAIDDAGNDHDIPLDEATAFLADPTGYFAKWYGVEVSKYKRWAEVKRVGYPECWAITKTKRPCRSQAFAKEHLPPEHPKDYDPSRPVYCFVHDDRTGTVVAQKNR